jgi:hypothetical protein
MSTLPPPPAPQVGPFDGDTDQPGPPPRPGQLTPAWRVVYIVGWVCVLLGFGAISRTSVNLGLSTWWLGPSSDRRFLLIQVLPFVPGAVLVAFAARNMRFLPYFGAIGALLLGAIAGGDLGRFNRLAATEFIVAAAALLISLSTFAGVLRTDDGSSAITEGGESHV